MCDIEFKISEAGKDKLFCILEEWHNEHLPALQADQVNEQMLDYDDTLVRQLHDLVGTEIRMALEAVQKIKPA